MTTITQYTGGVTDLSAVHIEELRARLQGEILLPDHPSYDRARTVWNAAIDKRSQRGLRLLHTQAQEAQEGLNQNGLRDGQRHVNDDDAQQIWCDVPENNSRGTNASKPGGIHKVALAKA